MSDESCPSCSCPMQADFLFCPYCGVDLKKPLVCPKCSYQNEANSRFCQECGAALRASEGAQTERKRAPKAAEQEVNLDPVPGQGITIEFPFTSAQSFDFAVNEARKLPTFKQFGADKKAIYRVTVSKDDLAAVSELLEQLKGWRKRTAYLDGQKAQWDNVFGYTWCHVKKSSCYKPEFYCLGYENDYELNVWGCIQARMPFNEHGQWFCWGKWLNNRGDWQFDKDRIRHELEKNLYNFRFCPALKTDKIEAVLAALPETVNPARDRNWKFVESWGDDAVEGITVVTERFGVKEKVTMKGVCPNGPGAIREIAKKAQLSLPEK